MGFLYMVFCIWMWQVVYLDDLHRKRYLPKCCQIPAKERSLGMHAD